MVYATYSEGFRNGGNNPVRPISILPTEFARTHSTTMRSARRPSGSTTGCGSMLPPTSWSGTTSPSRSRTRRMGRGRTGVFPFALGYVNLPSAEIKGIESEFTFVVNDAWQVDATLGYNDAEISEATVLSLVDDLGRRVRKARRRRRAAAADARLERLAGHRVAAAGQIVQRAAVRARRFRLCRRSRHESRGFESVIGQAGVNTQDAYETARPPFRTRGRGVERRRYSSRTSGTSAPSRSGATAGPCRACRSSSRVPTASQFRYDF